jgi:FADH2 O2-dependent halogenase
MSERCEVAIVGSGFAGSLLARLLAVQGYDVVLFERGMHPRFAIGESSTPLANLSLERIAARYGLADCDQLAAHGRWLKHLPHVRRGLKRGFTFYRHHPGRPFENAGPRSERLMVAASPNEHVADTHWLRADVDHHFVQRAVDAGVDYRDRAELTGVETLQAGMRLRGQRNGNAIDIHADFVIDASGPGGFLARHLPITSGLDRTRTHSGLVFSHFSGVRLMSDVVPSLPVGPFPDDWAAVHHIVDEGWMYSLRFDDGLTSAGFVLSPRGLATLHQSERGTADAIWRTMLGRYPTIAAAFESATPTRPVEFHARIQHRLTRAAGERWALLPHAYAFVDPLFSTGIAWSLRAVERLAMAFEPGERGRRGPAPGDLTKYADLVAAEADQIDVLVAGAYEAMAHFDLFAAHAMIYFALVSFAEVQQRIWPNSAAAWGGFLGIGDAEAEPLPAASRKRLQRITRGDGGVGTADQRREFAEWVSGAVAPRNIAGLSDAARFNLYPVDMDTVVQGHLKIGITREEALAALPALRGSGIA